MKSTLAMAASFLGSILGIASAPTHAPTLLRYHWTAHHHVSYAVRLNAVSRFVVHGQSSTSVVAWDPQLTMTTGGSSTRTIPLTVTVAPSSFRQGPSPARLVGTSLTTMAFTGLLRPRGKLVQLHWTAPLSIESPRNAVALLFPTTAGTVVPLIPLHGWTAGKGVLVPFSASSLYWLGSFVESRSSSPLPVDVWYVPRVADHHWTVTETLNTPSPLAVNIVLPGSQPEHGRMTLHATSQFELKGGLGGWLTRASSQDDVTIATPFGNGPKTVTYLTYRVSVVAEPSP